MTDAEKARLILRVRNMTSADILAAIADENCQDPRLGDSECEQILRSELERRRQLRVR